MSFFESLEEARKTLREESLLALEKQIEYLEWHKTTHASTFFDNFYATYGGAKVTATYADGYQHTDVPGLGRYLKGNVGRVMGEAPTYFVSNDMTEMIKMAAEEVKPEDRIGLSPAELLTPMGFLWFHHPVEVVGAAEDHGTHGPLDQGIAGGNFGPAGKTEVVGIRAIAWEQDDVSMSDGTQVPGIAYYLFTDTDPMIRRTFEAQFAEYEAEARAAGIDLPEPVVHQIPLDMLQEARKTVGPLALYDFSGWSYGRDWELVPYDEPARPDETPQGVHPVVDQVRCLLKATWAMLSQKIVEVGSERPPRAMRRRASRLMPETGDVVVIRLRKEYHPEGSEEQALANQADPDAEPWFSHRHLVRGHWKRQAYGKDRAETKLIWVSPYVRGPEDRPLIIKSKVYSLEH
jgi:hypothetical protein